MLHVIDGAVREDYNGAHTPSSYQITTTGNTGINNNSNQYGQFYQEPYTTWFSYPVYVTADKTKKAIDILKALQADKMIECKSVPKFIELVEKIAGLL